MANGWSLLKRIWAKKASGIAESLKRDEQKRIDLDLPLGLRIRGMVEVPIVDFVLGENDLKIKHPGKMNVVLCYGTYSLPGWRVHNFYLEAADKVYILKLATDQQKNELADCKLFMPLDEVYPSDSSQWDFWLNQSEGYIGLDVFETKDKVVYDRVWSGQPQSGSRGYDRVAPLEFTETLYHDAYGVDSESVNHMAMLYVAANDKVNEYLLLSAVEESEGASVQIMVGLALEPSALVVI